MPPEPHKLTVTGTCILPDLGRELQLRYKEPQGINQHDLLLKLVELDHPPDDRVSAEYGVEYELENEITYDTVTIVNLEMESIKVDVVSQRRFHPRGARAQAIDASSEWQASV